MTPHDDPAWSFAEQQWALVRDARLHAAVRMIPASRLLEPDSCMHEAKGLLIKLFDSADIAALGGVRATTVLYTFMRQFGSDRPGAAIVLQAIAKPVTVLRSTGAAEIVVAPRSAPKQLHTGRPKLLLYHTGACLELPQQALGLRQDPLRILYPDSRHRELTTVAVREWASPMAPRKGLREPPVYAGRQRSICTHPDMYDALRTGRPVPVTAEGPSLNLMRVMPRSGGGFDSVRFGVNFSPCGSWITDLWSKTSDLYDFLRLYSDDFVDVLRPILHEGL